MKNITCVIVILLFCLSSILPVVNSIYVEKSTDTLDCVLDNGLMDSAWPIYHDDVRYTSINSSEDLSLGVYKYHIPIRIDSNQELKFHASFEGWPGTGTEHNPYVIEDFEINSEGHNDLPGNRVVHRSPASHPRS